MLDNESEVTAPADTKPDTVEFESTTERPNNGSQNDSPTEPKEEPKPLNPRTQQRKAEKERLIREAESAKAEARQLKEQLEKFTKQPETKPTGDEEPKITDFNDVWEYNKALIDYKTNQGLKTFKQQQEEALKAAKAQESQEAKTKAYAEKIRPVLEARPELVQKLMEYEDAGLITKHLEAAVQDSDISDKLTEYLAMQPQAVQALSQMNEQQTYKAIGILEAQLSSRQESAPVRQTQAKAPIKPVGKSATTSKALSNMTAEEIEAMPQREFEAKYFKKR